MSQYNDHYLFVYGTLLNNSDQTMATYLNQQAKLITSGFLVGKLYKVDDYPGAIVTGRTDERVFGQIYSLQN